MEKLCVDELKKLGEIARATERCERNEGISIRLEENKNMKLSELAYLVSSTYARARLVSSRLCLVLFQLLLNKSAEDALNPLPLPQTRYSSVCVFRALIHSIESDHCLITTFQ